MTISTKTTFYLHHERRTHQPLLRTILLVLPKIQNNISTGYLRMHLQCGLAPRTYCSQYAGPDPGGLQSRLRHFKEFYPAPLLCKVYSRSDPDYDFLY